MKINDYIREDLSIQDLRAMGQLSSQAFFVCKLNGLTFLSEIVQCNLCLFPIPYRWRRSEKELQGLQERFRDSEFQYNPDKLKYDARTELDNITTEQYESLEAEMYKLVKSLSRHSFRALQRGTDYNSQKMLRYILDKTCLFKDLDTVGKKSEMELENLRLELIRFVNRLHKRG